MLKNNTLVTKLPTHPDHRSWEGPILVGSKGVREKGAWPVFPYKLIKLILYNITIPRRQTHRPRATLPLTTNYNERYVTLMKIINFAKKDCEYIPGKIEYSPMGRAARRQKRFRDKRTKLINDMLKAFDRYNKETKWNVQKKNVFPLKGTNSCTAKTASYCLQN